ncbi:MAG: hypothetical protein K2X87_01700, partial [Gemmataceae bacterium]|nr:hypothetical protein [Gemmataceae bacterium]
VPRGIVPLPDGRVLVRRAGAAGCYGPDAGRWMPSDDPGGWVPLGDGVFAFGGGIPSPALDSLTDPG